MKFHKQLLQNMVSEWTSKYVDYKGLKGQIKSMTKKALLLAESYRNINEISENNLEAVIDLHKLKEYPIFWKMIQDQVTMVNDFYLMQEEATLRQFHSLTRQAVKMGFLDQFDPEQKGFTSRLERELARAEEKTHPSDKEFKIRYVCHGHDLKNSDHHDHDNGDHHEHDDQDHVHGGDNHVDDVPQIDRGLSTSKRKLPVHRIMAVKAAPPETDDQIVKRLSHNAQSEMVELDDDDIETVQLVGMNLKKHQLRSSKASLKANFSEFYRGLMLLQGYCRLNHDAFNKILKKYDKTFGTAARNAYLKNHIHTLPFYKYENLKILITETELVFSRAFTKGRRTQAMEKLRVPVRKKVGASLFRLGLNTGLTIPMIVGTLYLLLSKPVWTYPAFESIFIVYRMLAMAVLMVWAWAFDMWMWTKYRVNYVFIFNFDQRHHVRYHNILEIASLFTLIWTGSLSLYVFSATRSPYFEWLAEIPFQLHPLLLLFVALIPIIGYQFKSAFWLVRTLGRIVGAPFFPIEFRDFFLADQLASLSIVLYDIEYTLCFFAYDAWAGTGYCMANNYWVRPVVAALPAIWRFLQCLRRFKDSKDTAQLLNACKYSATFFVSTFSVLRANHENPIWFFLWLFSIIFATLYSSTWDIIRDWGLGDKDAGMLRKKLLYPTSRMYYFAIVSNVVMRLMWTLTISPESIGIVMDPLKFSAILAGVEIARRSQWNLFRLENEQLNNVGKFRAVNIEVPPSDRDTVGNVGALKAPQVTLPDIPEIPLTNQTEHDDEPHDDDHPDHGENFQHIELEEIHIGQSSELSTSSSALLKHQ